MPVKGGSELIKYILDNHPDIAVIIITAYPSADSAINAVKSGVFDYFTKPFKTEDMLSAVQKALEKKEMSRLYGKNSLISMLQKGRPISLSL